MILDISPLYKDEGVPPLEYAYELTALPEDVTESTGLRLGTPVVIRGSVACEFAASKLIRMDCSVKFTFAVDCARCGRELTLPFASEFTRYITADPQSDDAESEAFLVAEDMRLDVDEAVMEVILLEMPLRFLCGEDCKGLCPKCGADLNDGDCGCPKRELDPRWEALNELLRDE